MPFIPVLTVVFVLVRLKESRYFLNLFLSPGGNEKDQEGDMLKEKQWQVYCGRKTIPSQCSRPLWRGFTFRHLDHFAHLHYHPPGGLCRHFAVTCDQNHPSGLIAQRCADAFSSEKMTHYCPTTAVLSENSCETGQCLRSRSSHLGREGMFMKISEQPTIYKEKNQKH